MKIIDRYLIIHFLIPFFYCIFAFLILYITYDLSINLDEFLKYKVSIFKVARYYLLNIPLILVNSTPIAILLASLYSLGNMNRHHEIVAMRASGIHIDRIIVPFLILGTILAVVIFIINDQFVCKYSFEGSSLKQEIFNNSDTNSSVWKNFPFRDPSSNRDWFVESFNYQTKELQGVTVREFGENGEIQRKIIAQNCRWINNGQWLFLNGTIFYYTSKGLPVQVGDALTMQPQKFAKMIMPYEVTPADFENSRKDVSSMNFRSLLRYLMFHNKNSRLYRTILIDLHNKIAFPFVCIVAVLVGIPFAIKTQRGGFIKGIGICIIIFLAYYGMSILSVALGKKGALPPLIAVWLPNVVFLLFGAVLLKHAE